MNKVIITMLIVCTFVWGNSIFGAQKYEPMDMDQGEETPEEPGDSNTYLTFPSAPSAGDEKEGSDEKGALLEMAERTFLDLLRQLGNNFFYTQHLQGLLRGYLCNKTSLVLSQNRHSFLTDTKIRLLSEVLPEGLKELRLNCRNLTSETIITVLKKCKKLKTLALAHCPQLTKDALSQIITHPTLISLQLYKPNVTKKNLEKLLDNNNQLRITCNVHVIDDEHERNYLKGRYSQRIELTFDTYSFFPLEDSACFGDAGDDSCTCNCIIL